MIMGKEFFALQAIRVSLFIILPFFSLAFFLFSVKVYGPIIIGT